MNNNEIRLLVVEDEPTLNKLITAKLTHEGYRVDHCADGGEALDMLRVACYDAALLDIMLPEVSGLDVLKSIRSNEEKTPVLLLTARDSVEDRVAGLDAGADDYLVKPFAFEELLARVRVLLRRAAEENNGVYTVANLTLDCGAHTVKRANDSIELSHKEFAILEYLIKNAGTVVSRDRISRRLWDYSYEGGSNIVDVYIRYIRKKIDDDFSPKLIHTVRGAGYVLRTEE